MDIICYLFYKKLKNIVKFINKYKISNNMIIYNPHNETLIKKREKKIKEILNNTPAKYCFITGSFLYKENYKDIDVFAVR